MYRSGVPEFYARSDFNKFSSKKHAGYSDIKENTIKVHGGKEISRLDGLVEVSSAVDYEEIIRTLLGPPLNEREKISFVKNCH